jgi:enamine deaminase RidA (YjgF/YER057c/UK114 family)
VPKVIVNPSWLPKPSGFSHGIEAQGRTLYIAGQTAQDAEGRIAPVGDLVGQFRHALANVGAVVGARGGTLRDLVKVTFYVVDKRDYRTKSREIGVVYREMMEDHWPATTLVEVRGLWDDDALIEIDATAVLG